MKKRIGKKNSQCKERKVKNYMKNKSKEKLHACYIGNNSWEAIKALEISYMSLTSNASLA
jgi:hypothetical protein